MKVRFRKTYAFYCKRKINFYNNVLAHIDSDDSEGEGGIGNLNRLIIRPPGHSGKAKKGHLCFDASFETGK